MAEAASPEPTPTRALLAWTEGFSDITQARQASLRERIAEDADVLVITAFEDMETAVAAMKAGAYDYLVKPLDLKTLATEVRNVLDKAN